MSPTKMFCSLMDMDKGWKVAAWLALLGGSVSAVFAIGIFGGVAILGFLFD